MDASDSPGVRVLRLHLRPGIANRIPKWLWREFAVPGLQSFVSNVEANALVFSSDVYAPDARQPILPSLTRCGCDQVVDYCSDSIVVGWNSVFCVLIFSFDSQLAKNASWSVVFLAY